MSHSKNHLLALQQELVSLQDEMISEVLRYRDYLEKIPPDYRDSAVNLIHYLVLRRRDLRDLQDRLASLGLSSLGRCESHVFSSLQAVSQILEKLTGKQRHQAHVPFPVVDYASGNRLLCGHTEALLGAGHPHRGVRIMVTMPSEAADDYTLIHDLLEQGMDCMRINCAHDDSVAWQRMIDNLRRAEKALGKCCRVVMDLGGPKLRTGPLEPGPAVMKVRPKRDSYGRVIAPARIWLTSDVDRFSPPTPADACLYLRPAWLSGLRIGEKIKFTDSRDAKRSMTVIDITEQGCWAELFLTSYFIRDTLLRQESALLDKNGKRDTILGYMRPVERPLLLQQGDLLVVTRDLKPGRNATYDSSGDVLSPATIGCTIPKIFDDVKAGESIWFDDGKIGGIIEKVEAGRLLVRITRVRISGEKLRSDKGINLPDSELSLEAMTEKDIEDLPFIARHADVVELSFANTAGDVEKLHAFLSKLEGPCPAVVLKIETRRGFRNLPEMLLVAMRSGRCGIMIARGDLAVECGFERMAELQEEILWICESAHVPVIWATQVLETLAKEGMPSRAEITDAAMGHRAECVMLNKGPHILSALRVLDDILSRMQQHQNKKRPMLRELQLAHTSFANGSAACQFTME